MNETEKLEARVAALERSRRQLTRGLAFALVVLASTVWMGQRAGTQKKKPAETPPPVPRVVEAERFVVKKADGQIVATLGITDGVPMLRMSGPDFTERLNLSLARDGTPQLTFLDRGGQPLARMAVGADGETSLEIDGAGGSTRLSAGGAAAQLGLEGPGGELRAALVAEAGTTSLKLNQTDGTPRVTLGVQERGPDLTMTDENGANRITLNVRPEQAVLGVRDAKGEVRAGLAVERNKAAFALYDEKGRAIFQK
ncbi:MAG: hypothetical protein ACE148_01315 [Vicinamibacterales bacterium]